MIRTKRRKFEIGIFAVIVSIAIVSIFSLLTYFRSEEMEVIEPTPPVEIKAVPIIVKPTPQSVTPPAEEVFTDTNNEETPVIERISLGEFRITAYCPCSKCCGKWADGITYTGTWATENYTIAVDPSVIPLGSTVEINGVEYVAEDIGGAIKKNRIDIFFESHKAALEWGVQYHDVYLIN